MAKDGTYNKVPLKKINNAVVGAETDFTVTSFNNFIKPLLMAASLLFVLLGYNLFRVYENSQPYYYMTLDINPSMEMSVTKDLKIIHFRPLNEDAKNLSAGMKISGQSLYQEIGELVKKAAEKGYLKQNQDNYIVSSLVSNKGNSIFTSPDSNVNRISYDQVNYNIEKALEKRNIEVKLVVLKADKKTRQEAENKGLSTGKYLIYRKLVNMGSNLSIDDFKKNSITKLINTKQIKLPTDADITIKVVGKYNKLHKNFNKRNVGNTNYPGNTLNQKSLHDNDLAKKTNKYIGNKILREFDKNYKNITNKVNNTATKKNDETTKPKKNTNNTSPGNSVNKPLPSKANKENSTSSDTDKTGTDQTDADNNLKRTNQSDKNSQNKSSNDHKNKSSGTKNNQSKNNKKT